MTPDDVDATTAAAPRAPRPALELAVQDAAGVVVARDLGLDRVELCTGLGLGGLTPSAAAVESALRAADGRVEVHVLVRPRDGDYHYGEDELAVTVADVRSLVGWGVDGVVVGALRRDGMPDLDAVARWQEAAGAVEVTFHRAVDVSADPVRAVEQLASAGLARVLTSGGPDTALEGRDVLRRMVEAVRGAIQVMAGGGVLPGNAAAVAATGVDALHFAVRRRVGGHSTRPPEDAHGRYDVTDRELAAGVLAAVRG